MQEVQRLQGLWLKKSATSRNSYKEQKVFSQQLARAGKLQHCKKWVRNDLEVTNSKATTIITRMLRPVQA